jgi:hypothetical protein
VSYYGWLPVDLQQRIREHAVKDVLEDRLSVIGAAVVWDVKAADLERWVDEAKNNPADKS